MEQDTARVCLCFDRRKGTHAGRCPLGANVDVSSLHPSVTSLRNKRGHNSRQESSAAKRL